MLRCADPPLPFHGDSATQRNCCRKKHPAEALCFTMLMLYLAEALRFIMWMMLAGNVIEAPELELLCCKNLCLVQVRQCVISRSASNGIVTNTVSGAELRFGTKVWFGLFTFHTFMLPVVGTIDVLSFHPAARNKFAQTCPEPRR